MQRWIVMAVVGALLAGAGGGFALWNYRENRPKKVWVPLPLNAALTEEKREQLAAEIKAKLLAGTIIADAVEETDFASKMKLTPEQAEAEARQRLFVELGETDTPMGRVPSVNIGFNCQRKSFNAYGSLATRLMKDVWKMLGIKEPEAPLF